MSRQHCATLRFRNGRNPLDDGGLVALLASEEQRGVLANVQALMSLLEGHGNAVMNQLGIAAARALGSGRRTGAIPWPALSVRSCRAPGESAYAGAARTRPRSIRGRSHFAGR